MDRTRAETCVLALLSIQYLILLDEHLDIKIIQVLESVALGHMLPLLINDLWIASIHDTLNEMRCVINFG